MILFALEREAAPFRRLVKARQDLQIHVSGVGRQRAKRALEQILQSVTSPRCVIAAGYAGALHERLRVGDRVIAREIVDRKGGSWRCSTELLPSTNLSGRILTSDHLVAEAKEKEQLGESYKALAVDMESAGIAEVCVERGLPFLAIRAISDTLDTQLSPQLIGLLAGGHVSPWQAIRALLKKPNLLSEFRRLARDTRLAGRNLGQTLHKILSEPPLGPA